jgi:A118 family predicted phage portal protein
VFKYNIANNFDFSPLGINVCANSIGLLKSIDDKFFSALEDSINSRKKIFFDEESSKSDAIHLYDEDNNKIVDDYVEYLDRDQTLYKTAKLGDDAEKLKIYTPTYEPESHNTAIQFDLNLLSLKTQLGTNYFDFENGGVYVNEANVFSSNSDMWRNRQANANLLKRFLHNMMKSIIYLEGMTNEEYCVTIDDSMIQDDAALKAHSMELVNQGYKPKWKHLVEWEGYTEEEAKQSVADAQAEQDTLAFDFVDNVENEDGVE